MRRLPSSNNPIDRNRVATEPHPLRDAPDIEFRHTNGNENQNNHKARGLRRLNARTEFFGGQNRFNNNRVAGFNASIQPGIAVPRCGQALHIVRRAPTRHFACHIIGID